MKSTKQEILMKKIRPTFDMIGISNPNQYQSRLSNPRQIKGF